MDMKHLSSLEGHVVIDVTVPGRHHYRWEFDTDDAHATKDLSANMLRLEFRRLRNEVITQNEKLVD